MRLSIVVTIALSMLGISSPGVTHAQDNAHFEPDKINLDRLYDVEMSQNRNSLSAIETAYKCGFVDKPRAAAALSVIESEMQREQATDLPYSAKDTVLDQINAVVKTAHDRATITFCNKMKGDPDHVVSLQEMVEAVAQAQ